MGSRALVKRALDVSVSLCGLVFGLPLFALVGGLVWIESGLPVLFSQVRTGKGGGEFLMRKFRTMRRGSGLRTNEDGSARVVEGDERVTKLGRLLREFGLDELPQFWNVLRGDMSLVGPRPYMPMHTAMTPQWARLRLEMRPGLVCLAEVYGRNSLPWVRRLQLDVYYVKNWSLCLDVSILLRAVPVVLFRRGVYSVTSSPDSSVGSETRSAQPRTEG